MYKVGGTIETWFSDEKDGKSTILEIKLYDGKIIHFTLVLKVTAPRTKRGWMELCV